MVTGPKSLIEELADFLTNRTSMTWETRGDDEVVTRLFASKIEAESYSLCLMTNPELDLSPDSMKIFPSRTLPGFRVVLPAAEVQQVKEKSELMKERAMGLAYNP